MNDNKQAGKIQIPAILNLNWIFFSIVLVLLILLISQCSKTFIVNPVATRGNLDLKTWDFKVHGPIKLDGEWEFYWRKLINPTDFESSKYNPDNFMHVPGYWNRNAIKNKEYPAWGFATLRLQIKNIPAGKIYGFKIRDMNSSYRLWYNHKLITSNGEVGISAEQSKPELRSKLIFFPVHEKDAVITLQIGNFEYSKGGPRHSIQFAPQAELLNLQDRYIIVDMFIIGCLFFMSFYHLVLFIYRPSAKTYIYFSLLCFVIALRTIATSERILSDLLGGVPFEVLWKISHLTFYLAMPFFISFITALYKKDASSIMFWFANIVGYFFTLLAIVTTAEVYSEFLYIFQILAIVIVVYVIFIMFKAVYNKREGAIIFMLGMIVLGTATINDILYAELIINSGDFSPLGTLVFVLANSIVLSGRFSRALSTAESLSLELDEKVRERTDQLENANLDLKKLHNIKNNLFANISHEIRTPLTLMISPLDSLFEGKETRINKHQQQIIYTIRRNGERLLKLINSILDLTKMESDKMSLHLQKIDLNIFAKNIQDHFQELARQKHTSLEFKTRENYIVEIDPEFMEKVLLNLYSNAVKFTENGQIITTITGQDNNIELEIKDTGIGISNEHISIIFERFRQIDSNASREYAGTGIGLALCKEIMRIHGGSIRVDSVPLQGSSFTIEIPFEHSKSIEPIAQIPPGNKTTNAVYRSAILDELQINPDETIGNDISSKEIESANDKLDSQLETKKMILVVEDNLDMRNFLYKILAKEYRVEFSENGIHGLESAKKYQPDLIVSDVMMPGMDGLNMMMAIRQNENTALIPVLLLTAKADKQDQLAGLAKGADGYITKPFLPQELLLKIKNILDRNSLFELIVLKERNKIFANLHDYLGGSLADLTFLTERFTDDNPKINIQNIKELEILSQQLIKNYEQCFQDVEDLNLLREDFLDGIHLILLRRYARLERKLAFSTESNLRTIFNNHNNDEMMGALHAVFIEIATNDLKYGVGDSTWRIKHLQAGSQIMLQMEAKSKYNALVTIPGRGKENIKYRIEHINGKVDTVLKDEVYQIEIRVPYYN